jgi:hypothetical protein
MANLDEMKQQITAAAITGSKNQLSTRYHAEKEMHMEIYRQKLFLI